MSCILAGLKEICEKREKKEKDKNTFVDSTLANSNINITAKTPRKKPSVVRDSKNK